MNRSVPESLLICILVLCLALTPVGVRGETEDSGKAQQLIEAPGAVLMEKETGTVIYSKDPDTRRSPASITKIMTLILIFDAIREGTLHLEDSITTSAYARSMGGSQVFLEEGEKQTVETMIKCIVIASGNDASVAMAEHVAGTEQAFVERMNERAKDLGMKKYSFCGLLRADGITGALYKLPMTLHYEQGAHQQISGSSYIFICLDGGYHTCYQKRLLEIYADQHK